jgi:hypothetical protein
MHDTKCVRNSLIRQTIDGHYASKCGSQVFGCLCFCLRGNPEVLLDNTMGAVGRRRSSWQGQPINRSASREWPHPDGLTFLHLETIINHILVTVKFNESHTAGTTFCSFSGRSAPRTKLATLISHKTICLHFGTLHVRSCTLWQM